MAPEKGKFNVHHPDWSRAMVLYEVNLRQYTPEGTFRAFADKLPRVSELGVDVLWLMPVHPIGLKGRKGELGSYYAVRDFRDVNAEHGNLEDFKFLLDRAHELGFHLILDWVPNHTACDHPWTIRHPEWYISDDEGAFIQPWGTDWTDVFQLDWSNTEMQDSMLEDMKFWIRMGVDGFRVDHPHNTLPEFWSRARKEMEKIRPVLLLAENEEQTEFLERGFDMNYAWVLHHHMNDMAAGKKTVRCLRNYFRNEKKVYPCSVYRLNFLTNHDENTWAGSIKERLGQAHDAMAALIFTVPGVPLIYSGQESCLEKRLEFFRRDPIEWKKCERFDFYRRLIEIMKSNPALWNGEHGGGIHPVCVSRNRKIFGFYRQQGDNRVLALFNLSKKPVRFLLMGKTLPGVYRDAFSGEVKVISRVNSISLGAWNFRLLIWDIIQ